MKRDTDSTVLMSESLTGRLDSSTLYGEESDVEDLMVSFWVRSSPVCAPVESLTITQKKLAVTFTCGSDIASNLLISKSSVSDFSICKKGVDVLKIGEKIILDTIDFKLTGSGHYLCEVLIDLRDQ